MADGALVIHGGRNYASSIVLLHRNISSIARLGSAHQKATQSACASSVMRISNATIEAKITLTQAHAGTSQNEVFTVRRTVSNTESGLEVLSSLIRKNVYQADVPFAFGKTGI